MKAFKLVGNNATGAKARIGKEVTEFTDDSENFSIEKTTNPETLRMATSKGVYYLKKNPTQNIYQGVCNGHKVHVSLKAISGELRFW